MMAKAPQPWVNAIVRYGEESPDQLLAHPSNPKIHPKAQQDALAGAIGELGWLAPVIVNERSGRMLDGHARVGLAISRGELSVPVAYVDLPEEQEALALATFDPVGALAVHDKAMLADLLSEVSTGDAALQAMLNDLAKQNGLEYGAPPQEAPEAEIDRAEELREKWQTATGQLWVIGRHRLLCGDATKPEDTALLMSGITAALLATDPPYNVGIDYGDEVDDSKAREVYEAFTRAWFGLWSGVTQRQIVTPGCNNLASWLRWFDPYHVAPWTKTNAMTNGKVSRWWCWEPLLFFGSAWGRERSNDVFDFAVPPQHAVGMGSLSPYHPCPKPLPMWVDLLTNYSEPGDSIVDTFVGSGTTMVAAEQTGRLCYGMEISEKYTAVCLERLSAMGIAPRLEAA